MMVTVEIFKQFLEESLMEMESYLLLESETSLRYKYLSDVLATFKEQTEIAMKYLEENEATDEELTSAFENARDMLEYFYSVSNKSEEELLLTDIHNKVVRHKNFAEMYIDIEKSISDGEVDMNELLKVTDKYMNDLEDYEQNYAVCYVAEEMGIGMENLDNNDLFE